MEFKIKNGSLQIETAGGKITVFTIVMQIPFSSLFNLRMLFRGIVTGGPAFLVTAGLLSCTGNQMST